jgi:hypothetical protein
VEAPLSLNSSEKEPMTTVATKAISCLLADSKKKKGFKFFADS